MHTMQDDAYYARPAVAGRQLCQLLYPRRCAFCGRVLGFVPACPDCAPQLRSLSRAALPQRGPGLPAGCPAGLSWAAAPFFYDGVVRRALLRAKYGGQQWAALQLGCVLAHEAAGVEIELKGGVEVPRKAKEPLAGFDWLVPVPSSGRGRSYNVPALLARPLSRGLGIPLAEHSLYRTRQGTAQAGLAREKRQRNAAGLFAVADAGFVQGQRLLLVDDVITTGATVTACAQALLAAGAEEVAAVSLATPLQNMEMPAILEVRRAPQLPAL